MHYTPLQIWLILTGVLVYVFLWAIGTALLCSQIFWWNFERVMRNIERNNK